MANSRLAVATMCLDKKGEPELMLAALGLLSQKGYHAFIADGGSSSEFVVALGKMGHHVEQVQGGLTYQHKNAIQRAAQSSPNVLYMEPDKFDWVKEGLEKSVDEYFSRQLEFAAVCRTPEQIATFPPHQQKWEAKMNEIVEKETGVPGDYVFGPRSFPSDLARHLEEIQGDRGWAALMFLVGRAKNLGLSISTIYHAAACPTSQRQEPNEEYRIKQFTDNVNGFYLGLGKPVPQGTL